MPAHYTFYNLIPSTAYRFRVKFCSNETANKDLCTSWTEVKPLATKLKYEEQSHEWAIVHIWGTGLNNHNASFVKIDDNVLLDAADFTGLNLIVLDRSNLSVLHN